MKFNMTFNELAFYMYSYHYRKGVKDNEWRQRFFDEHSKELANFVDILTNHPIVPPLEAFGESFGIWPKGLPPTEHLERFLNEWAANSSTAATKPEQSNKIPLPTLPTDEDARRYDAEREARLAQSYGDTSTPSNLPQLATMEAQSNGDTSMIEQTEQSNFFICKSANQWIQEAKQRPNPEPLYMTLWFQGEHCCLFADSNIGKSVLAVQIGTAIAQNRKVLLFDFELSDKMFQMRYTDDETQQLYDFPPNLLRLELNPESKDIITANLEDAIIKNIELAAIRKNAQIIIIDNLTWLSNQLEKGDAAGQLMQSLQGLTRKYGWSILSIAHTPKRNLSNPVTQNDLAGSKKLMNFFDSAFAIARSRKDERLVYVKQIKVRNDVFRYGEDNVIVYEIVKDGAFLHLKQIGYATEREHLQSMDEQEKNALKDSIIALLNEGKTQKQAAAELGISESKVCRILKK